MEITEGTTLGQYAGSGQRSSVKRSSATEMQGEQRRMSDYKSRMEVPALVRYALRLAKRTGFANSCIEEVGRLLAVLTRQVRHGIVGEVGTGCGVGAAWIASALDPSSRFVTVDADAARAEAVRLLLRQIPAATTVHGDWREILAYGPFDLLFLDASPAKSPPGQGTNGQADLAIQAVRIGGLMVMDDFTPEDQWPEEWQGRPDPLREFWLNHPGIQATEVLTTSTTAAILAARTA